MSVCRNYECIEWQKKRTVFILNAQCIHIYSFFSYIVVVTDDVVFVVAVNVNIVVCLSCLRYLFYGLSFPSDMTISFRFSPSLSPSVLNLHLAGGNYCLDVMYILLLVILSLLFCITRDAINSVAIIYIYIYITFFPTLNVFRYARSSFVTFGMCVCVFVNVFHKPFKWNYFLPLPFNCNKNCLDFC